MVIIIVYEVLYNNVNIVGYSACNKDVIVSFLSCS